jgi:hypothetical protein
MVTRHVCAKRRCELEEGLKMAKKAEIALRGDSYQVAVEVIEEIMEKGEQPHHFPLARLPHTGYLAVSYACDKHCLLHGNKYAYVARDLFTGDPFDPWRFANWGDEVDCGTPPWAKCAEVWRMLCSKDLTAMIDALLDDQQEDDQANPGAAALWNRILINEDHAMKVRAVTAQLLTKEKEKA